jgi:2-amino-4-hydroxy-6-hydroxymethyldihydropteridine diphosphokinase
MGTPALIGLGSNLGDRKAHLDRAVAVLSETPGVSVRAVSSYHETRPVGGPAGQGAFLNAAALVSTDLSPHALLNRLHRVESDEGRVREIRWDRRTLDLDLLIYGSRFLVTPELTLPHPRMAVRRFVLAPAAEIAPHLTHVPTRRSIADLLALLDRRPSLLTLAGPASAFKTEVFHRVVGALPSIALKAESLYPPHPTPGPSATPQDARAESLRAFDASVQGLDTRRWASEDLGPTWLVADFTPSLDWGQHRGVPSPLLWRHEQDRRGGPATAHGEESAFERTRRAYDRALVPTLAVVVDPSGGTRPVPWGPPHPVIWPESGTVDAVVNEALAACRATRPD